MGSWQSLESELELKVCMGTKSPLIIQHSQQPKEEDKKNQPNDQKNNLVQFLHIKKNGRNIYYIPGSSIKGVLRNHTEKIFYHLNIIKTYIGDKEEKKDLDAVSRLFGSRSYRGRLSIEDAFFPEDTETEKQEHVAIDRFRGGAKDGALFSIETINNGFVYTSIRLKNPEPWEVLWLSILIRDIQQGKITLGAKSSYGYGQILIKDTSWDLHIFNPKLEEDWKELLKGGESIDNIYFKTYSFSSNSTFIKHWEKEWEKFVTSNGKVGS